MFNKILRNAVVAGCLTLLWAVAAPVVSGSDFPHAHDCATAVPLKLGGEETVAFANVNDRAVYRVVLDSRGLLDVRAEFAGPDTVNVDLLDSSCNQIRLVGGGASVVTGRNSALTIPSSLWTLGSGVYFVRFDPIDAKVAGRSFAFEATFTPHYGHDCATAEPMDLVSSKGGELLYPQDREAFFVTLTEAGSIHAWAEAEETSNPPYVNLRLGDCSLSSQADSGIDRGIITGTLEPGRYYLSVEPDANTLGPFILHVEFSLPQDIDYPSSDVPL